MPYGGSLGASAGCADVPASANRCVLHLYTSRIPCIREPRRPRICGNPWETSLTSFRDGAPRASRHARPSRRTTRNDRDSRAIARSRDANPHDREAKRLRFARRRMTVRCELAWPRGEAPYRWIQCSRNEAKPRLTLPRRHDPRQRWLLTHDRALLGCTARGGMDLACRRRHFGCPTRHASR